jgi:hypothetical protein
MFFSRGLTTVASSDDPNCLFEIEASISFSLSFPNAMLVKLFYKDKSRVSSIIVSI